MQQALHTLRQSAHAFRFRDHRVHRKPVVGECSGDRFAIHGEQNDPDVRHHVFQHGGYNDAIRPGHRHIQQNQIGLEFPSLLDSIFAIDRFTTNFKISLGEICMNHPANGVAVIRH